MTEEIIIDVSNCPHKSDDDCMGVPICNEYGDLMGYQSCEAQTLCPYRSQKKIERLEQENKELKKQIESDKGLITIGGKQQYDMTMAYDKCKTALEEISKIAAPRFVNGLNKEADLSNLVMDRIQEKIDEVLNEKEL